MLAEEALGIRRGSRTGAGWEEGWGYAEEKTSFQESTSHAWFDTQPSGKASRCLEKTHELCCLHPTPLLLLPSYACRGSSTGIGKEEEE